MVVYMYEGRQMRKRTDDRPALNQFLAPHSHACSPAHSHPRPTLGPAVWQRRLMSPWLRSCSPGSTNVHNALLPSRPLLSSNLPSTGSITTCAAIRQISPSSSPSQTRETYCILASHHPLSPTHGADGDMPASVSLASSLNVPLHRTHGRAQLYSVSILCPAPGVLCSGAQL